MYVLLLGFLGLFLIQSALGGFKVSFVTDNIQGAMVLGLILLAVISVGVETDLDRSLIESSGYLEPSLLGWQQIGRASCRERVF